MRLSLFALVVCATSIFSSAALACEPINLIGSLSFVSQDKMHKSSSFDMHDAAQSENASIQEDVSRIVSLMSQNRSILRSQIATDASGKYFLISQDHNKSTRKSECHFVVFGPGFSRKGKISVAGAKMRVKHFGVFVRTDGNFIQSAN